MAGVRHERALTGKKPHCPRCDGIELRRQGRIGFWQRVVLPKVGVFPWECGLCRNVYMLRQRSTEYRQHSTEASLSPRHPEFAYAPIPPVLNGL